MENKLSPDTSGIPAAGGELIGWIKKDPNIAQLFGDFLLHLGGSQTRDKILNNAQVLNQVISLIYKNISSNVGTRALGDVVNADGSISYIRPDFLYSSEVVSKELESFIDNYPKYFTETEIAALQNALNFQRKRHDSYGLIKGLKFRMKRIFHSL